MQVTVWDVPADKWSFKWTDSVPMSHSAASALDPPLLGSESV